MRCERDETPWQAGPNAALICAADFISRGEMLETRHRNWSELSRVDSSALRARREVTATIDRLVYYAG